jgi:hypothetical protein
MTLQQVLDHVDEMKPNSMSDKLKIAWLNEIEGLLHQEIILKHEHTAEEAIAPHYDRDSDPGTVLLVPTVYAELYTYWIMSKIDLQNMEIDKYNNDRALFNASYETFSDYWTRTHMPIQVSRELRI